MNRAAVTFSVMLAALLVFAQAWGAGPIDFDNAAWEVTYEDGEYLLTGRGIGLGGVNYLVKWDLDMGTAGWDFADAAEVNVTMPDTGQTKCYDGTGKEISCPPPGDPMAQDGSYTINSPSFSFSGTAVQDNTTGLLWQSGWDGVERTAEEAAAYCEQLVYHGKTDWRLPTIDELVGVFVYGSADAALDRNFFTGAPEDHCLVSSSLIVQHTAEEDLKYEYYGCTPEGDGYIAHRPDMKWSVICVSGRQSKVRLFADNKNGTIVDLATGLLWQQVADSQARTWTDALAYCEQLVHAGFKDWRLPNVKELRSMAKTLEEAYEGFQPSVLDTANFSGESGSYWTSTTCAHSPSSAFYIDFATAFIFEGSEGFGPDNKVEERYVRCVRGGP